MENVLGQEVTAIVRIWIAEICGVSVPNSKFDFTADLMGIRNRLEVIK